MPPVVVTEHLVPGRLVRELRKVEYLRDPPVPVEVRRLLPGQQCGTVLLGWAHAPNGAGGLYGLVWGLREYAPGFWAEFLWWAAVDAIRRLSAEEVQDAAT